MKNILLTLCFLVAISANIFSQNIDYPRYTVDSLGNKVIVMTIEQAMVLDNNSELLLLFEKLNAQIGVYDSACVTVINDKEKVIAIQKVEISKLKTALSSKDGQIFALQKQVAEYIVKIGILEEESATKQGIIKEKDLQISGLKTKMIIGGSGGGLVIIGLILALVLGN